MVHKFVIIKERIFVGRMETIVLFFSHTTFQWDVEIVFCSCILYPSAVFEIRGNNHCGGGTFEHWFRLTSLKNYSSTVIIFSYFKHCSEVLKCCIILFLYNVNEILRFFKIVSMLQVLHGRQCIKFAFFFFVLYLFDFEVVLLWKWIVLIQPQCLRQVGEKLGKFEVDKRRAVEMEDFDLAKHKKVYLFYLGLFYFI